MGNHFINLWEDFMHMDYVLFGKLILDLQKAVNEHNFDIIKQMF